MYYIFECILHGIEFFKSLKLKIIHFFTGDFDLEDAVFFESSCLAGGYWAAAAGALAYPPAGARGSGDLFPAAGAFDPGAAFDFWDAA